jgi:hypothetical protein
MTSTSRRFLRAGWSAIGLSLSEGEQGGAEGRPSPARARGKSSGQGPTKGLQAAAVATVRVHFAVFRATPPPYPTLPHRDPRTCLHDISVSRVTVGCGGYLPSRASGSVPSPAAPCHPASDTSREGNSAAASVGDRASWRAPTTGASFSRWRTCLQAHAIPGLADSVRREEEAMDTAWQCLL